jgi:rifampin ADP-ribosylating transferase
MEFSPSNNVIKLCVQGMDTEGKDKPEDAGRLFLQAWNEAANDFEKYIAAYYVARHEDDFPDKLKWLETALRFALRVNNEAVTSAFPGLYSKIAECYEDLGDTHNAKKNLELANSSAADPSDKGPFYHGTEGRSAGWRSSDSWVWVELQIRGRNEPHLFYSSGQWSGTCGGIS